MKGHFLILLLILGIYSQKGWAPPPGKGGASGAQEVDISKCDLNPSKQTKVKVRDKDGREHFICTGQAVCGGKSVPVSCKVSEREQCPTAKICIRFEDYYFPGQVNCDKLISVDNAKEEAKNKVERAFGDECSGPDGGKGKFVCLRLKVKKTEPVYVFSLLHWQNEGKPEGEPKPYCYVVTIKEPISCGYCSVNGKTKYWQNDEDIKWATYENPHPPRR